MAGLSGESKSNIAFKRLIGKTHTSNQTPFYSESIASQIWIGSDEVLGEAIPEDPQAAINKGVAEFVECELEEIAASNGLTYDIVFPSGYSGHFNASSGDLVRDYTQVVSKKNNLQDGPAKSNHSGGYVYRLYDDGSSVPLNAAENWQVDPVAGTVVSESQLNLTNGTVKLYLYTGKFLDEIVSNIKANIDTGEDIDKSYDSSTDTLTLELATNIDMGTLS